jgi:hypothetical protein
MTIGDLKLGQTLLEGRFEVVVTSIKKDRFDVQYISGAVFTYTQKDLDSNTLDLLIY